MEGKNTEFRGLRNCINSLTTNVLGDGNCGIWSAMVALQEVAPDKLIQLMDSEKAAVAAKITQLQNEYQKLKIKSSLSEEEDKQRAKFENMLEKIDDEEYKRMIAVRQALAEALRKKPGSFSEEVEKIATPGERVDPQALAYAMEVFICQPICVVTITENKTNPENSLTMTKTTDDENNSPDTIDLNAFNPDELKNVIIFVMDDKTKHITPVIGENNKLFVAKILNPTTRTETIKQIYEKNIKQTRETIKSKLKSSRINVNGLNENENKNLSKIANEAATELISDLKANDNDELANEIIENLDKQITKFAEYELAQEKKMQQSSDIAKSSGPNTDPLPEMKLQTCSLKQRIAAAERISNDQNIYNAPPLNEQLKKSTSLASQEI